MRLIFLLALFLAVSQWQIGHRAFSHGGGAPVTPSYVQDASFNSSSSSVSSVTATFGTALTAGNRLAVCVFSSTTIGTVTWSGDSGTFTADITNTSWGSTRYATCATVASLGGGGTTITATTSLSYPTIQTVELHGGTYDQTDAGHSGSGTTLTSNSITPTANNSLVLCFGTVQGGTHTFTAGTNVAWTLGTNPSAASADEYYSQTTAAAVSCSMTYTTSANNFGHVMDFKP